MKHFINIIFLFIFFNSNAQIDSIESNKFDSTINKNLIYSISNKSFKLKVIEIIDISDEIEIMLDRYVFNKKKSNNKMCYKNGFIYITISPYLIEECTKKEIFDSLYSTNDFRKTNLSDSFTVAHYRAKINLLNLNSKAFMGISGSFNKIYYFEYKNLKVLIVSFLPLKFNEKGIKEIQILENMDYIKKKRCDEFSITENTYFDFSKGYITEIRYKDLIHPPWTGGKNMFK